MSQAVTYKFTRNPELMNLLLSTGDQLIAEASPYDPIWGIGLYASQARTLDPSQWKGQNLLGQILMEIRTKYRKYLSERNCK